MDFFDGVQKIMTGVGSVGVFIGLLVAWKSGLLSFIWNLKKNGNGNGHNREIIERLDAFENNHLEHIRQDMTDFRKELRDHADKEIELLNRIVFILEIKHDIK